MVDDDPSMHDVPREEITRVVGVCIGCEQEVTPLDVYQALFDLGIVVHYSVSCIGMANAKYIPKDGIDANKLIKVGREASRNLEGK